MRFLLGFSALLLVAACSGASSSELFAAGDPVAVDADAATEPQDPGEPGTSDAGVVNNDDASSDEDVVTKDAAVEDATVKDAAVKDATVDKCFFDTDCKDGDLCNWKTDQCAAAGPIGAPCKRDLECTNKLCNWKVEACSNPAPSGAACRRNKECASGSCGTNSICK